MTKSTSITKSNPYLIVQDNEFINFRHTLSVQEARVFLSIVAQVEKEDEEFKIYKIEVNEFVERAGLKRKDMYSELKKVSDQLTSKKFRKEKEDGSFLITNYISSAEYQSGDGFVQLTFDPKLKPYLLGLKSHFTKYDIRNILSLRSIFSILIFQQLKQFEKIGERTFNLIDLKFKLNVDDKFKKYNDFKKKVLLVAEKEIKENCDIYFRFEEIKKGRKIESIKFYIYSQTPPRDKVKSLTSAEAIEDDRPTDSDTPAPVPPSTPQHQEPAPQKQTSENIELYALLKKIPIKQKPDDTTASVLVDSWVHSLGFEVVKDGFLGIIATKAQPDTVAFFTPANFGKYTGYSKKQEQQQAEQQAKQDKKRQEAENKRFFEELIKSYGQDKTAHFQKKYKDLDEATRAEYLQKLWDSENIKGIYFTGGDKKKPNNFAIEKIGELITFPSGYDHNTMIKGYAFKTFGVQVDFDESGNLIMI